MWATAILIIWIFEENLSLKPERAEQKQIEYR
jgi:hypothetical protein